MIFKGKLGAFLQLAEIDGANQTAVTHRVGGKLTILWFQDDQSRISIDGQIIKPKKNQIICLTEFHRVEVDKIGLLKMAKFNRAFYCILDHDREIGCKGALFFGANQLPFFSIQEAEIEKFETLWKMFVLEMNSRDQLQLEMLQMMLKRLLILCTRLYKDQFYPAKMKNDQLDIIREFNFLVEMHYREKHSIQEYATLIHKSPKTISNIFAKAGGKTPLQYIQERRMLEARRSLSLSDKSISDVAFDVGFEDVQAFSRFFKRIQGVSPTQYRLSDD